MSCERALHANVRYIEFFMCRYIFLQKHPLTNFKTLLGHEHLPTMNQLTKPFAALLLTSGCTLALSATPLTDAEFKNGAKPVVTLKNCKKLDGVVEPVTNTQSTLIQGKFHVFVSSDETPDAMPFGTFSKQPTQAQLDSLKGLKFCYVPG